MRAVLRDWKITLIPVLVLALLCANAFAQERIRKKDPADGERNNKDIVATAASDGRFQTFVRALRTANLAETLKQKGPFTVFMPVDEAFKKLNPDVGTRLFNDTSRLRKMVKYHVVPGRVTSSDMERLDAIQTWLGRRLAIDSARGLKVDGARVVRADLECRNGLIHVIDAVLVPRDDLIETARKAGTFATFLKALEAAKLTDMLRKAEPFTLFAPTDEAFGKLPAETLQRFLEDPEKMKSVLTMHLVRGSVPTAELAKMESVKTLHGAEIRIDASEGLKVAGANVVKADMAAANGVIHAVDAVILVVGDQDG